jgi:prophage regulatory protein
MSVRIYRFRDLRDAGVPFTRKHVDHLEKHGDFPKRFNYGANSVGWVGAKIDAWVQDRIASRDAPPAEVVPLVPEPVQSLHKSSVVTEAGDPSQAITGWPIIHTGPLLPAEQQEPPPPRRKVPGRLGRPPGAKDRRPRQRRQAEDGLASV